jgi:ribose 5-phosphate isomerase B
VVKKRYNRGMKVVLASDHAGFELKKALVEFLQLLGHEAVDMGPHTYDEQDDYPDFILPLAHEVANHGYVGVIIGGSGEGEAMAANRVPGVRAAVYYGGNLDIINLMREHNDANVLSLGARFMGSGDAEDALRIFLDTAFSGDERHVRRIGKLDA